LGSYHYQKGLRLTQEVAGCARYRAEGKMNKTKAIGGCLGTFLAGALGVGLVGWIVTTLFPKITPIASAVGGTIVLILMWNAITTLIKIIKQKGVTAAPAGVQPAAPEASSTDPANVSAAAPQAVSTALTDIPAAAPQAVSTAPAGAPVAAPQVASTGNNRKRNLTIFVTILAILGLAVIGFVCYELIFKPLSILSSSQAVASQAAPSPACSLICDVNTQSYGFKISCESGPVSNSMNDTTNLTYDNSGQVSQAAITVDENLTYSGSGNTYHVFGTIINFPVAGNVTYNIQAIGGAIGTTPQTCANGATASGTGGQSNPQPTQAPQPASAPEPAVKLSTSAYPQITTANIGQLALTPSLKLQEDVVAAAFSPDGKRLAFASMTYTAAGAGSTFQIWNTATGEMGPAILVPGNASSTSLGHKAGIVFSPDGKTVAAWGTSNDITLWDAGSGSLVKTFSGHTDVVNGVAFSPDGQFLASASQDGTARVWNVASDSSVTQINVPQNTWGSPAVLSVAFNPDGKTLATGNDSGYIHLWNPQSGQQLQQMSTGGFIDVVTFSPKGAMLASSNHTSISGQDRVQLWDMNGNKIREMNTDDAILGFKLAFSPDGTIIASAAGNYNAGVQLWEVATGQSLGKIASSWAPKDSITFSPDGRLFVIGGVSDPNQNGLPSLQIWAVK